MEENQRMKVAWRVWLDNNGKAFGKGPYELLRLVEQTNSLHRATRQLRMSYSKAWRLLQMIEKRLGYPLLERSVGGSSGGGSQVTPAARELMKRYARFQREIENILPKIYRKHFENMGK